MQFKSRYDGELVLSKGDIRTRRPIRQGEVVSFSGKTVERFGDNLLALAKKGMLAPFDDEAREFVKPGSVEPKKEEPKKAGFLFSGDK
jgi:hypothetical protein